MGIFGGVLSLFLGIYGFIKIKYAPGGKYFILATIMCAVFMFAYIFELTSDSINLMKLWLRIEYLALPYIPVFVLLMCYEYVEKKLPRWAIYILLGMPVLTIFIHYTNEFHNLYYKSVSISQDTPFPTLDLVGGPWFYVHSFFLYICIILSIVALFSQFNQKSLKFRMQIFMMVAGLVVPIIGNVIYLTGIGPYGLDFGPLSMSISFIFHGIALVSYQMFNVVPIARDTVFESMQEGVIVLDQKGLVIDYNEKISCLKRL